VKEAVYTCGGAFFAKKYSCACLFVCVVGVSVFGSVYIFTVFIPFTISFWVVVGGRKSTRYQMPKS